MLTNTLILLFCGSCFGKDILSLKSENHELRKKSSGFIFSMPKTLLSGKNETVCVSLHDVAFPVKIIIDLKWKEKHYITNSNLISDSACLDFNIPSKRIPEPQFVSVKVQLQTKNDLYTAHNQDPILVYPKQPHKIYIETDRGLYKPEDTVKLVFLQLNYSYLPVTKKISEIRIRNPMGVTVMVWEDVVADHGLVMLEYHLVAEAMMGKWRVEALNQTRFFEVGKYTTPRFKIELKYPKVFYYKSDKLSVTVCARYSFNKPLAGIAFIRISSLQNNMESVNKLGELISGCKTFSFNQTELNLQDIAEKTDPKWHLYITSTVTEYGTNKMDVVTARTVVATQAYHLKLSGSSIFIPGLPYQGHLKLTNIISQIPNETIEICYNLAIKKSWNYFNNEQCQNYTTDDAVVPFRLWPFKNNVLHVHLHAKAVSDPMISDKALVIRLYSPSSSFIQVSKLSGSVDDGCTYNYTYRVSYSADRFTDGDKITFYYNLKTNLEIMQMSSYTHTVHKQEYIEDKNLYVGQVHKYVKLGSSIDQFNLSISFAQKYVSKFQLLVYYIAKNGETVATTRTDDVEYCSLKVEADWSSKLILPGTRATLHIKSASPALCAISATDKSSKFLLANQRNISLDKVIKTFSSVRDGAKSGRNSCINNKKANADSRRKKRHVYSFSEDYDAYDIFSKHGIITISNLPIISKSCYSGPLVNDSYQVQFLIDHYDTTPEDNSPSLIRSQFPENWLWELVPVTNSVQLHRDVPHSITNWITNVFCVSENDGVGFAQEVELTSLQPFFLEVLLPYSIKKGESFNLLIHVFNYANYTFPIRVTIGLSEHLEQTHQVSNSYCLESSKAITHNFPLSAIKIGTANLTVMVESDNQYPQPCGPETMLYKRDVVFKSFSVEPEGYFMSTTKSALLCASDSHFPNNITWKLNIPRNIVPLSDKVIATVNADLLGRSIENLNQLVTIPTGCGEQIMASMAPNLYILRYLTSAGSISTALRQRIIRNLKMGYQRILNYLHSDGSFSAFGYHDPAGSMFLTAFVVKILQESRQFIYVDQRVIDKAVKWIIEHQLENGCFDTMYHVFQDMGGTNKENSTAGLTAYVILSLFDAKVDVPDDVQTNAKYCIRSQEDPDKYTLIISCYALFKVHWISEASRYLEKVIGAASRDNEMMWWASKAHDSASDIELTSYGLICLLQQKTSENMAHAHHVVQWLMTKISSNGGFKSTQDTIVALEALIKYSEVMPDTSVNLKINIQLHDENYRFVIADSDRLKSKQVQIRNKDGDFKTYLTGSGCALVQLSISYHTTDLSESEAFKLKMEVSPVSNIDQCSIKTMSPCISYDGPDKVSNMAVMEVALPSGFQADRSSLYELVDSKDNNIKMFQEKDDQVTFYFTSLGENQVCFSFTIHEQIAVADRKDSIVKLYDYYRPELSMLQFYRIVSNCSRKGIGGFKGGWGEAEAYMDAGSDEHGCLVLSTNGSNSLTTYHKDMRQLEDTNLGLGQEIPECIKLSAAETRRKRDLNKNFKDLFVEPETPQCLNVPFYVPYNNTKPTLVRYKKSTNKDFVDLDVEMESPNCYTVPFYTAQPYTNKNTGKYLMKHIIKYTYKHNM